MPKAHREESEPGPSAAATESLGLCPDEYSPVPRLSEVNQIFVAFAYNDLLGVYRIQDDAEALLLARFWTALQGRSKTMVPLRSCKTQP